ncbi:tetratricopeptide repeat protein [Nocardia terpenica]|uniref:Uncharacterized protein n=1 Tax=Nocardia terpenica TaxID=455432 RepID=A0A291RS93_9NOCA|nr:tetratricopeptide repeat protein [Nocardia terpenica]ATL70112.1 hypothetical protein CRH09_31915 [Nocardia terpenica]
MLLAGRLAHHHRWSIADLAESFTAATDRLAELKAADRAVRATFDLSYRDLPERQRIMFRRLGLHPGTDLDIHAAAALAGIPLAAARQELEGLYTTLGYVHRETGAYEQAADLHRQALALYRNIGHRLGQAEELDGIGRVLLATGEPGAALMSFTEALGLARAIGNHLEQARALDGVARCRAAVGDTPAALTDLRAALAIYRRLGVPETHAAAAYLGELEALTPGAARSSTDREQVR